MVQAYSVTEAIQTLAEAEAKLSIRPAADPQFFSEWQADLPELTDLEQNRLDLVKQRYLYHRRYGPLAEGTVNFIVISPLLELAGFFDPPFRLRSEVSVTIEVEDQDRIYRGRIDSLVLMEQLWVVLVESKQTTFNFDIALPQALAYMMAGPRGDRPTYGFVSNGGHSMFVKVAQNGAPGYALSDDFSLYRQRRNELWDVLQTLKRIGQGITLCL